MLSRWECGVTVRFLLQQQTGHRIDGCRYDADVSCHPCSDRRVTVPGASEQTRRVKNINANWKPDTNPPDGQFELQVITDDDERHSMAASASSMSALAALAQADPVFAWDPTNRVLITANVVGIMAWTQPT